MKITLTDFKVYIPSVTLADERLQKYLDDAARAVKRDGFDESHEDFDELQRVLCLALMQEDKISGVRSATSAGQNPDGISSIGVAGISIGFQSPSNSGSIITKSGKTGYYLDYELLKKKISGFKGRIA